MVLVVAGVAVYAYKRPKLYRSETRIVVESASLLDEGLSPSASRDRTEERAEAIRQLVQSRSILERIVEEFRLRSIDSSIFTGMEDALASVRGNLEVSNATGNTFSMAYMARDPQVAQAITRRLADILIETNQSTARQNAQDKDEFLNRELMQAQRDVEDAEREVETFKTKHLGALPEQAAANMNALSGLNSQLVALDNALERSRDQLRVLEFRVQEQKRLSELARSLKAKQGEKSERSDGASKAPSPLEAQLSAKRAELAAMTARYTPRHPDLLRVAKEVEDLEERVAAAARQSAGTQLTPLSPSVTETAADSSDAVRGLEASAESEIAQNQYEMDILKKGIARREKDREALVKDIMDYRTRLNLGPKLDQELLTLTRQVEVKRQHAANLQTRRYNAQIVANAVRDKKNETYSVRDQASLPEKPMPPTQLQIILIGIGAGFGAGITAAFAREYFEPSLSSEPEATAVLKLPVLVSLPETPDRLWRR
jgi:polysaccharide chain length determinant protein (PEP-CTERM system associated)